uniref:lipid A-modifier LpxR family protein n=1 Tax=Yoonia sp. TaxID=2212373 RepID=UPI0040477E22
MRHALILLLATATLATPAFSEGRKVIGNGRLFSNDFFGDGGDRWRSGSYVLSIVQGQDAYTGQEAFGDIIEYRLGGQIIAGTRSSAAPGDRPYVGAVAVGVHTPFKYANTDFSIGADVMAIGPQTGLSDFQQKFHDGFGITLPPYVDQQLDDAFFVNGTVQASRTIALSDSVTLRPFFEGLTGAEDLVRAGGDVIFGQVGQEDLMIRDVVTGQLYRGTQANQIGLSYTFGADVASVFDSAFLPADQGYNVSETRARARAGVLFQFAEYSSFFYGATYLSEEFEGQREGQVVGSLKLNFNF